MIAFLLFGLFFSPLSLANDIKNVPNEDNLKKILPQTHQVFQEIWRKLTKREKLLVNSVFTEANKAFQKAKKCPEPQYFLKTQEFWIQACGSQQAKSFARYSVESGPQGALSYKFEINRSVLRKSLGLGLSTLGGQATCRWAVDSKAALQSMECEGLGGDLKTPRYLFLDSLKYQKGRNPITEVKYKIYSDLVTLERTGLLIVPLNGKIQITETIVKKENLPHQGVIEFSHELDNKDKKTPNRAHEESKPKACSSELQDKEICDPGVNSRQGHEPEGSQESQR